MKVALVGLPQSGKTSLFKALTGTEPSRARTSTRCCPLLDNGQRIYEDADLAASCE